MTELALILVATVLVNNFVLTQFLGLCPFMGVSRKVESALGMALATGFVLTLSSVVSYLVNTLVLAPLGLEYLRTIAFILVIAAVVQFTEMMVRYTSPLLHKVLGIFLPLITTNCAVLGVALLNVQQQHSFIASALYGFGAAAGFDAIDRVVKALAMLGQVLERTDPGFPERCRNGQAGLGAGQVFAQNDDVAVVDIGLECTILARLPGRQIEVETPLCKLLENQWGGRRGQ